MTEGLYLTEPVTIQEVAEVVGDASLSDLAGVAATSDIVLGEFTDEELLICGRGPDAEPDAHWMPYLSGLDAGHRGVALDTAARLLTARGELVMEGEGYELDGVLGLLGRLAASAVGALTVRLDQRDVGTGTAGVVLLPHGLALHDDIDADPGLHVMVLRTRERESAYVAALLDPLSCCGETAPPIVAERAADLDPHPDELAAVARSATLLHRVSEVAGGHVELAVTSYGTDEALWLLQGRTGPEPVATLQRSSEADLHELARQLLDGSTPTPRRRRWSPRRPR